MVGIGEVNFLAFVQENFSPHVVGIEEACFFGFSWEKYFHLKYSEFRRGEIQPCSETFLFYFPIGRHQDGSKLNTQRKIFSLCAQWARIFDSTCGPVGQKFPPTGLEVTFTYSEFQRGQSQPKGKIFWHQWCRSCGSHRSPGRRSSQVVGNEMPQKTTPYENFFTLRPLDGKF